MLTTGNQLRAARALIEMEQSDLAERTGVNVNTIRNMEKAGAGPISGRSSSVQAVQRVLEAAGIEFLNHGQPGVKLRKPQASAADEDDYVSVLEWPAGKPLPRNYRDGANDLLSDEDRLSDEAMATMARERIARQDAEAARKGGRVPRPKVKKGKAGAD